MSDTYLPSSAENIEWAEENGYKVIFPDDDELLLDFDNSVDYDFFMEVGQEILAQFWGLRKVEQKPSPSGKPGHMHVRVKLETKVTPMERFALQAALGSDRKRELLGIAMLNNEDPHPTFLNSKEGSSWKRA